MSGRTPSGNEQQSGSSTPSTSSTSSSSLMARFYQPMNAPFVPPTPQPPPPPSPQQQQQQQQVPMHPAAPIGNQGFTPTYSQGLGPSAAQFLANLATTPGYISDEAILEYSRQHQQQKQQQHQQHQHLYQQHQHLYQQQPLHQHEQQQQQHQQQQSSHWQQPFSQPGYTPNQPPPPQSFFTPTQSQPPQTQGYSQGFSHTQTDHQQLNDYRTSSNPNAAIGALLKELQQTGGGPSSSSLTSSSTSTYPSYPSIPLPQLNPPIPPAISSQSQAAQERSNPPFSPASSSTSQHPLPTQDQKKQDDFSSGKITPQLLKKLAALAESDGQSGSTLLSEIKRLRSRQTKTERSLFEDREELLAKQKRNIVKLQASEIMGVNVENEMQRTKSAHREELKRFDQGVVRAMDKEITLVQESLAQAGVPLMTLTQDPDKIASQIRVLRLLEDMLQS
ncbi:MAG: hypothetical protein J3R72DRAFT_471240 [Linnemannia gamsii]|nr:MAG: hypothetical protein J3R72DRAFT_471240 [Linnemannia gamsii]